MSLNRRDLLESLKEVSETLLVLKLVQSKYIDKVGFENLNHQVELEIESLEFQLRDIQTRLKKYSYLDKVGDNKHEKI